MKPICQPALSLALSLLSLSALFQPPASAAFQAGASKIDITPTTLPVIRNGGFLEARDNRVSAPIHARALVFKNDSTQFALVIVDSCMIPRDICDQTKESAHQKTGIPVNRILIAATHTHSAPSVMNYCLGTRADPNYTKFLPAKIVEAILVAQQSLQPAQAGWTKVNASPFTANRRWIFRTDKTQVDPFGERTVHANMHPGHQHPDAVGASGPEDPWLSLLSIQSLEGEPLAVLANFSMHYFSGHNGVSSDYFGRFSEGLAQRISPDNHRFVGAMSQGTSGDLWWGDYGRASRQTWNIDEYVSKLLDLAEQGLNTIHYQTNLPLNMAEQRQHLERRLPNQARLDWAKKLNDARGDRRPTNRPEVYAEQAYYIDENPSEEIVLQALRFGNLAITAMPNEVYAITGLKIKARSPFPSTFNIELANGAAGYIPPPEQHALGGYTTWPARTAGLEIQAEPKIIDGVLSLLEKVTSKPRRHYEEPIGDYARMILEAKPIAYWRLAEFEGPFLHDASGNQNHGQTNGLIAFHLPGPTSDALGSPLQSRAIHLAGGRLKLDLPALKPPFTLECWLWNGVPHETRPITGSILSHAGESLLLSGSDSPAPGRLQFGTASGQRELQARFWHHLVLVREQNAFRIHLDGQSTPDLSGPMPFPKNQSDSPFFLGHSPSQASFPWEGKLDEVAFYNRALTPKEIADHYRVAGVPLPTETGTVSASTQPKSKPAQADQLDRQRRAILQSKPIAYWPLHHGDNSKTATDLAGNSLHAAFESNVTVRLPDSTAPNFRGGRLNLPVMDLKHRYSISLWFLNELPNRSRPVTGYLFSRGPGGDQAREAPGDHLGIGGTHSASGRIFLFNGNALYHERVGRTYIPPQTWNHVVFVRDGKQVTVFLNGNPDPEIHDSLEITYPAAPTPLFVGARNDYFAPFQGALDQVALYDRILTAPEVTAIYLASGLPAPVPSKNESSSGDPESVPLTAEESRRKTHVAPGYRLELAAAEPLVRDPVAIDWGPDRKLWVAEMADYPYGMDGRGKAGGRIRYLIDADQDGYYEQSQLFLDEVNFPTSVMAWRNGVLVTAAPEIFYAEDTDGDGKADKREVLFEGFIQGNQQLRVNSLRWGLDNWVYAASGGHHAGFGKTTQIKCLKNGQSLTLGSRDFRFRPDQGILDPQSGPAQFGRVRDDWGNWFGVQNSFPLWHYVLEDHYLRRNTDVAAPDTRFQVRTPPNPKVYQNKPAQKRFHSFEQSGRYTSACGPAIYRDNLLFPQEPGIAHAFTCEPFHNVVQHHIFRPAGPSFKGERASSDGPLDFFASADRWSRPVMARTGPDGALYVVDMYRYMIEHPDWLPQEGRDELKPHYRSGENYGRIFRIVPSSGERRSIPMQRGKPTGELVKNLGHSNGIVRDLAHRALLHPPHKTATPILENMVATNDNSRVRLQALTVLDGLETLTSPILLQALKDNHPGVRRTALRLAEKAALQHPELISAAVALARDPDFAVRLQLACTLGQWNDEEAGSSLVQLALDSGDAPYLVAAILSSANAHYEILLKNLLSQPRYARALMAMGTKNMSRRIELLHQIAPRHNPPELSSLQQTRLFLEVLKEQNQSWDSLDTDSQTLLVPVFDSARRQMGSATTSIPSKIAALKLLGFQGDHLDADLKLMATLLNPQNSQEIQMASLTTLAAWNKPEATMILLQHWNTYPPQTRLALADLLLKNKNSTLTLLQQLNNLSIASVDLSPAHRQQLLEHPDKTIARQAAVIFQSSTREDHLDRMEHYKSALKLSGHSDQGRAIFRERCASCHQLENEGTVIGPDLRSLTDRSGPVLLTAILDPSQNVEPTYLGYTATLKNNQTLYGLITSETGNSVIMKTLDGTTHQILRQNIQSLSSSRLSFMPEGLEADLSPQGMADLIAYLQSALN